MAQAQDKAAANSEDSKKIEQEFEQYQEKLKQQKAEWEKEHPDQVNKKCWNIFIWSYTSYTSNLQSKDSFKYHCIHVKTLGKIGGWWLG